MMTRIEQVIRYNVAGQEFRSYDEAERHLCDKFGEEIHEVIKKHFPDYAHRQACIDFVMDMWTNRAQFCALLDTLYVPLEGYDDDD